jgi:hypothetical protein
MLWSVYNLLINLLSRQSTPAFFRICINLIHGLLPVYEAIIYFQCSFWYYSQHPNYIPVSFPLLNPNWASTNTAYIFVSVLLLSIFTAIFAVYVMMLIVPWSLHFVAFSFPFKPITVTQTKSFGHFSVSYTRITRCWSVALWIWDHLLPIIWIHPPVSHNLLQPSLSFISSVPFST